MRVVEPKWVKTLFIEDPTKISKPCKGCGRLLWIVPSMILKRSYCTEECRVADWTARNEAAPALGWYAARFIEDPKRVRTACLECAKPMWLPRSKLIEHSRCSMQCTAAYRGIGKKARKRLCKGCTRPFTPRQDQVSRGYGYYCSRRCAVFRGRVDFWVDRKKRKMIRQPIAVVRSIGAAQRWKCAICRKSVKLRYHVDHIKPAARGGGNEAANLQLLCPRCNHQKGARDPIDYMQSLGRLL